ncbi:hypothetical protein [Streptomyces sp. NPDC091278]|uniref:hypothetical protein n=1 Tax=Streptomyces sp. NPDC091278 TaxID=3155301 RepID=UPI00344B8367
MPVIPLAGVPLKYVPILTTSRMYELVVLLRSGALTQHLPTWADRPYRQLVTEAYTPFLGRLWVLATPHVLDHEGRQIKNVRKILTTDAHQPWWLLPIHPSEHAYQFDTATGGPAQGSGRPYPHPQLPPRIAEIERDRCGPYRDAFGLCSGCGLRGRVQRRCRSDDPTRDAESLRAPYSPPWKWEPCPHACGYLDTPETDPDKLYGLVPQISLGE